MPGVVTNSTAEELLIATLQLELQSSNNSANIVVGISMIVASALCLLVNIIVIKAMWAPDLRWNNSYKFMIALGFADGAQSVVHLVTGFFTIYQTTWAPWFVKAMGVIATPGYVFYAVLTIVLSLDRLVVVAFPKAEHVLFSKRGVKCWFGLTFFVTGAFALALASPWASIIYDPNQWSWSYDTALPGSEYVQKVEEVVEVGGIPIAGVIYAVIFVFVLKARATPELRQQSFLKDIKILIQAFTITAYCTVLNVLWHNYQTLLPDTKLAFMGLNFMWIFNAAVNPLVYFVVNSTIRQRVGAKVGVTRVAPAGGNNNFGGKEKTVAPAAILQAVGPPRPPPMVNNFFRPAPSPPQPVFAPVEQGRTGTGFGQSIAPVEQFRQ